MVCTRRRKHPANEPTNSSVHPPVSQIFRTLVSAASASASAPSGLKLPLLQELYSVLVCLSRHPWACTKVGDDLNELVFEIVPVGISSTSKDVCRLSDILFEELAKKLTQLISALHDVSACTAHGEEISHPDMLVDAAELKLLLRCCMKMLGMLSQQHIQQESGQFLFLILRTLSQLVSSGGNGVSLEHSFPNKSNHGVDGFTRFFANEFVALVSSLKLTDSHISVLSPMLEVFIDELSVNGQLRRYFRVIDSVSLIRKELCMDHLGGGDLKVMMEVICTHFFLFMFKEEGCERFFNRLSWLQKKDLLAPEISLTAALSLLENPIMLSVPKLMQTHVISLVSDVIGFGLDFEHCKPDLKLTNYFVSAFRSSVVLYAEHIAQMQMDGHPEHSKFYFYKANTSGQVFQSFESYVQPVTREKLRSLDTVFSDTWDSHYRDRFLRSKDDLSTSAIAYMKENLCIFDISCRDEILSVVSCIITRVSEGIDNAAFENYGSRSIRDVCFLASLVKLMGILLLQIVWSLRSRGNIDCPTILENLSPCKDYDSFASSLNYFSTCNLQLPVENYLSNKIESQLTKHKESKLMLFHFLRLLSFSFLSRCDFLIKGCILCILAIMNLFVFEEGSLDALMFVIDNGSESSQQAVRGHKSSLVVATKFQKIRSLYLSRTSPSSYFTATEDGQSESCLFSCDPGEVNVVATEDETKETCNGVIFLRSTGEKAPDIDDLKDFIECKQGKDYCAWLKDRRKYRKWKNEKRAALMWKRKKHSWKLLKGKKV